MTKISNQYSLTNVLFADTTNGRVGIGASSPSTKLTIDNSPNASTNAIDITGYTSTSKAHIGQFADALYLASNYYYSGGQFADSSSLGQVAISLYSGATTTSTIGFLTSAAGTSSPAERMRITAAGNVGIGATSPDSRLYVIGTDYNNTAYFGGGTTTGASYGIQVKAGTNSTDYAMLVQSAGGTDYMRIRGDGTKYLGATTGSRLQISPTGENIYGYTNNYYIFGVFNDSNNLHIESCFEGNIIFRAQNRTTSSSPITATERMRITSGGFTKISNNGSYYSSTGSFHELITNVSNSYAIIVRNSASSNPYGMYINYNGASPNTAGFEFIGCADSTQDKFFVWSSGSVVNRTGSYGTISDIKFKENIVDATPKLDDILNLKVRNFNLKGEDTKQIGFIAQEFEEVFPAMIDISKEKNSGETYKSIKTSVLVPMLVKAIQEQQTQINELKALINA